MKKLLCAILILYVNSCNKADNTCSNGIQDSTETSIDCGGNCSACPTCSDGIKNQDEVEVDCGGICNACPIQYPSTGIYGTNILHGTDTLFLNDGTSEHSFRAIVPMGSAIKIELYSITGDIWGYTMGTNMNWKVSVFDFDNKKQIFESINSDICDLSISKVGPNLSTVLIKYFENDTVVTKERYLVWQ